jgi:hypothetical protein
VTECPIERRHEPIRRAGGVLGDRQHEADLLWATAIQYAELGRRDEALAAGQAAIRSLREKGKPEADVLADYLHKFRLCFTHMKAKMPHEDCPLGKWPQ